MRKLKLVFMGTPEFAVPMLQTLCDSAHEVVGVVTAPDKPAGRGMQLQGSDVKQKAKELGLHVLQPDKLKNEIFLAELKSLNADLFVVVAFRMLPEIVWNMPPMGTINLHASLLPQYRGAAPIQRAIMNGETETGVTTFFLQQEIDTGKIIFQEKIPIRENETGGELYQELMKLGANLLLKTVTAIADGQYPQIPQDHIANIHHAPKIFKDDCKIDWSKPAKQVFDLVRALNPYPGAYTQYNGKLFKIYESKWNMDNNGVAGSIETDNKTHLKIFCGEGSIEVLQCQPEGKRKMSIEEFLRGTTIDTSSPLS